MEATRVSQEEYGQMDIKEADFEPPGTNNNTERAKLISVDAGVSISHLANQRPRVFTLGKMASSHEIDRNYNTITFVQELIRIRNYQC